MLTGALINFQCSSVESNVIKQCVIDSITQAVAKQDSSKGVAGNGIRLGGSVSSGANAAYNQQFNNANQQQFFAAKKSKLRSNSGSRDKAQAPTMLEEDMQPEILEDF